MVDIAARHIAIGKSQIRNAPDRAAEAFRAALTVEPFSAETHAWLAMAITRAANNRPNVSARPLSDKKKAIRLALDETSRALELDARCMLAHLARAEAQCAMKQWSSAIHSANTVLQARPLDLSAHLILATCHLNTAKPKAGEAVARRACELYPGEGPCFRVLAFALMRLGRSEEAGEALEIALRLNPEDSATYEVFGQWQLEQGRIERALHIHREAVRLNPSNRHALGGFLASQAALKMWQRPWWLWKAWYSGQSADVRKTIDRVQQASLVLWLILCISLRNEPSAIHMVSQAPLVLKIGFFLVLLPLVSLRLYEQQINWVLKIKRDDLEPKNKNRLFIILVGVLIITSFILFACLHGDAKHR